MSFFCLQRPYTLRTYNVVGKRKEPTFGRGQKGDGDIEFQRQRLTYSFGLKGSFCLKMKNSNSSKFPRGENWSGGEKDFKGSVGRSGEEVVALRKTLLGFFTLFASCSCLFPVERKFARKQKKNNVGLFCFAKRQFALYLVTFDHILWLTLAMQKEPAEGKPFVPRKRSRRHRHCCRLSVVRHSWKILVFCKKEKKAW